MSIEQATTYWAASIVVAPKKGQHRTVLCCLQKAKRPNQNRLTPHTAYGQVHRLSWVCNGFSTLDTNREYWQVKTDDRKKHETVFTCQRGLYGFKRMPFRLKNAMGTLQQPMYAVLATATWQTALVFLDDIVIFSMTAENHIHHVRQVLLLLR